MLLRRLLWLLPLVIAIAGVLSLRRARDAALAERVPHTQVAQGDARSMSAGTVAVRALAQKHDAQASARAPAAPTALPASLVGSEVDGALRVDGAGQFIADAGALRLFEYFLSALGELDEAALRARIQQEIAARLPIGAQAAAGALLDDYLRYRREAGELGQIADDPAALHAAVDRLYALRREAFGEKLAETLFADEEQLRTAALERRLILEDKTLSPGEREQRLHALDRDLPDALRQAREQAALPLSTRDQVAALRARGASDQEVYAARAKALGPEAAERLRALDLTRADFARRLAAFRAQRDLLVRDVQLPAHAKDAALSALFDRIFSPDERARARVLTR